MTNDSMASDFTITPADIPNKGIVFVDHQLAGRTGHLGHALVEYAPDHILAFYSNCDARVNNGHNGDGWMEYKRSEDGGKTWSEPFVLDYSKKVYDRTADRATLCEKAVRTDDGTIILFNLECRSRMWEPYDVPSCSRSSDGGQTWVPSMPLGDLPGRVYDARVRDGCVYVLVFCNDAGIQFFGKLPEHHYRLYVSTDHGRTFSLRSTLPISFNRRAYGTMTWLSGGRLIVYVYHLLDEKRLDYTISDDDGRTWSAVATTTLARQIRNPQVAAFKGGYVLHGRSGSKGDDATRGHFVLYRSPDGINWDDGRYLAMREHGVAAYSNNLLVGTLKPAAQPRLLIQASYAYEQARTNILHWWLT